MAKINTLEDALERIKELEKEVALLKGENKKLLARNFGGRKKHDEAWMASYNDFAIKLENGMTISEIVAEGTLEYDGQKIITAHIDRLLNQHIAKLPLVGSIPCGDPETEEQQNGEYIEVPISFVGSGSYYVLIADGDSMINAGINDGDMVIVRRTATANYGQIIVALDENNRNTLKRYEYDKKQKRLIKEKKKERNLVL